MKNYIIQMKEDCDSDWINTIGIDSIHLGRILIAVLRESDLYANIKIRLYDINTDKFTEF